LFKRALAETGQVCILTRNVGGIIGEDVGGGRTTVQDDNPFDIETVRKNIISALSEQGYTYRREYIIINVPNIVDISYGRGVGYTITEHDLGDDIHNISATKIRKEMRLRGELE